MQLIYHYLSTPTVLSDHKILDITLNYSPKRITTNHFEENNLSKFNYSNADCDKLNQALSEINWNTAIGEECTNKVHNFLTKVEQVCRNTLPLRIINPHYISRTPLPPYIRKKTDQNLKIIDQNLLLPILLSENLFLREKIF